MLKISSFDRKQDNSVFLQRPKDVEEEEHLIERIQPQVSHYIQDGVDYAKPLRGLKKGCSSVSSHKMQC